ncbi:MAG: hypothetical protein J6C46_09525 [Clostridia bacterium]|nr:hypothetical protein [Clostridia bacterium]
MEELKEKIEEIVEKVKNDPDFAKKFQEDPVTAVEGILGVDLPNDKINEILDTVKAKIKIDESGIMDKIKGLFSK